MKLEQQVCSPPLARRLHELGVVQTGSFWWNYAIDASGPKLMDRPLYEAHDNAFTVAQLGEMLPKYVRLSDDGGVNRYISITHGEAPLSKNTTWYVYYDKINADPDYKAWSRSQHRSGRPREANAFGALMHTRVGHLVKPAG